MLNPIPYEPGMQITEPCAVVGMPNEVYQMMRGSITNSGLTMIDRSPAHFKAAHKWKSSRAKEIGSAIHAAILEPHIFRQKYAIVPDTFARTDSRYKEVKNDIGGEFAFTEDEGERILGTQKAIYDNHACAEIMAEEGWNEISLFAQDPETGAWVRVRFDRLTKSGKGIDLKKTRDARPDAFSRAIWDYKYHRQAALYSDVYKWLTGQELDDYLWWAVEDEAPYAVKVYSPDRFTLEAGQFEYRRSLNTYVQCVESGIWPAYIGEKQLIGLPSYAQYKIEDDMDMNNFSFGDE